MDIILNLMSFFFYLLTIDREKVGRTNRSAFLMKVYIFIYNIDASTEI